MTNPYNPSSTSTTSTSPELGSSATSKEGSDSRNPQAITKDKSQPFATGTGMAAAASSQQALDKVVDRAHQTVDRVADAVTPPLKRVSNGIDRASDAVHSRAEDARDLGDRWTSSLRSTVRENPVTSVMAAMAVGMLVARLTS